MQFTVYHITVLCHYTHHILQCFTAVTADDIEMFILFMFICVHYIYSTLVHLYKLVVLKNF